MTARQRRGRHALPGQLLPLPPRQAVICAPGHHAFSEVTATVDGKPVATRVVCTQCHLTFQQVMDRSPEDLALYRAFLEHEKAAAIADHNHDPDSLPFDDCPGCARIAALEHSEPEELR